MERKRSGQEDKRMTELLRRHRALLVQKRNLSVETVDLIKKQENEIENLEKEKEEVQLIVEKMKGRAVKKSQLSFKAMELRQEKQKRELEKEREKRQEIDQLIWIEKRKGGQRYSNNQRNTLPQEDLSRLENQLQLANSRFGKLLDSNNEMRDQIQSLRTHRIRFDKLVSKIEKKKRKLQQETIEVISACNLAHKQREEGNEKRNQLEERNRKEVKQHVMEKMELMRVLQSGVQLEKFIETKLVNRSEDEAMKECRIRKEEMIEAKKRCDGNEGRVLNASTLRAIQEYTGVHNLEEIVNKFLAAEESNFSLFNFVSSQSEEVDKMKTFVDKTSKKIEGLRQNLTETKVSKENHMKTREGQVTHLLSHMTHVEKYHAALETLIQFLSAKINKLYNDLACGERRDGRVDKFDVWMDKESNRLMIGEGSIEKTDGETGEERTTEMDARVDESNILEKLSAIEKRGGTLVQFYMLQQKPEVKETKSSRKVSRFQLPSLKLPTMLSERSALVSNTKRSVNFKAIKSCRRGPEKVDGGVANGDGGVANDDDVFDFSHIKSHVWVDDGGGGDSGGNNKNGDIHMGDGGQKNDDGKNDNANNLNDYVEKTQNVDDDDDDNIEKELNYLLKEMNE